ncbi:heat shock transcription factor, Y-linked-like isoform X1 [Meleagris gallopavo]|uniref:HSF-type DNA-binding domain-containing protein n=1 Tax=Meleagris gallopavo TaxID=9103 RepID=G1N2B4_MELGA|nr:heat shock transcription factor, Y-linked-like isoform X1 [Meleagris gallopavo]
MEISLSETPSVSVPDIDSAASASSVLQVHGKADAQDAALGSRKAENTSQGSLEEASSKRQPLNLSEKCSGKANDFSSFSFLKKLWEIVESNHFQSIWWADDGNSIVIEETFFKREVLARRGCLQIFNISNMKTFIRQLHLHRFFIIEGDLPRSASRAKFQADEAAVSTSSKFLYYYNPYFRRDYPHLLRRFKRSTGIKKRAPGAFSLDLDLKEGHLSRSPLKKQSGPAASVSVGTELPSSIQDAAPASPAASLYHVASSIPNGPFPPGLGPDTGAAGDGIGHQHNLYFRKYRC